MCAPRTPKVVFLALLALVGAFACSVADSRVARAAEIAASDTIVAAADSGPAPPPSQVDEATGSRPGTFGQANWVAPNAKAFDGDPTAPGARVAERDHEPTGEKILRAPFRLVFLPVRVVARGSEALVSFLGPWVVSPPSTIPNRKSGTTIGPAFQFSSWAGLQAGVGVTHRFDPYGTRLRVQGTWSTEDHRGLRVRQDFVRDDGKLALLLEGRYRYRPTMRFYGLGNETNRINRSISLDESGRAEAMLRIGRSYKNNVSLIASYLETSARVGYNDSPGVKDVFPPDEVDMLFGRSRVAGLGIGAEMENVDDMRDPSLGLHGIAEVRHYRSTDGGGLDYRDWHVEARAYVPVFAKRRVLAFRAVHENVDPMDDSAPIPISLMPDTESDLRFVGYRSHRFRDRHLLLGSAEYRWLVWRRMWALGIAQVGEVASDSKSIRIADIHESYGFGLRYAFDEETTGRLTVANGTEGVYVYLALKGNF